jgi:hypothetical protein
MNNIYRTKGMKHIFPYIFDIDFVNGDFFFPVWMEERTILSHWWRKGLYCLIDGGKDYTVSWRKGLYCLMEERTILSLGGKDYTVSLMEERTILSHGGKDYAVSLSASVEIHLMLCYLICLMFISLVLLCLSDCHSIIFPLIGILALS